ncbi:MAG TPA: 23S rRNA pseudouridine(1911/1915/1917) synthase RluD [Steroidobacteraceae bacterium]|nr:23S rRNA pseudouridine(1911/1915/1917) synthase RluD [Steroidobacteraceae bacterium]
MPTKFRIHDLEVPAGAAGQRFDATLAALLPQYSRARLQRWISAGAVLLEGRAVLPRQRLAGGEKVRVEAEFTADQRVGPEAMALRIVFEDEALLVIDKPAGLVVHPGAGNPSHTLQNALLAHDGALSLVPRAGLIHRLDKDTSGLLVVARTPECHTALVTMLQRRDIKRGYLALCLGTPTSGGTIDQPIGRHRSVRTRMAVRRDGREAVTHYRIEERFRGHTLLRVQLETGRTHQIRVHLAHAGFPIVGDGVYGGRRRQVAGATEALRVALQSFRRQALHAQRLGLDHPLSGRHHTFEAPLPADFSSLLAALRADLEQSSS